MIAALALLDAWFSTRRNERALHGQALFDYQDRRACEIVKHARAHAPFYARHFAGHDRDCQWRTLPTVDKQLLMANFGDANTHGVSLEAAMATALASERSRDFAPTVAGLTVGLSSGTSGHRGLFLADRAEQARWVGTVLARMLPPFRVRGYTISLFSMSGSNLYNDMRGRWLRFHHRDLATPLAEAVRALNREQPDLLCGPPTYLHALSAFAASGELRIAPMKVVSVAEVLEPHVRTELEARFGCMVHQVYQCTEGLVALTCRLGRLHAQEDLVATQWKPLTRDGNTATPIITDLWHRSLPIIRYQLRDVVTLSPDACGCGCAFQVIEQVEGRADDVCEFTTMDGALRRVFPATLRRMVLLSTDAVADYDVAQDAASRLRVTLTPRDGADPNVAVRAVQRSLLAGLREQGIDGVDVQVTAGDCEVRPGKRRRIRRQWSTQVHNGDAA